MDPSLQEETVRLKRAWMRHDDGMLRDYLVADVEDPRLNVPSLLTRHFLIDAVTDGQFAGLMEQELRFAVILNWLLDLGKDRLAPEDFASLLHALDRGADNAEGIPVPPFAASIHRTLPVEVGGVAIPNYLRQSLESAATGRAVPPSGEIAGLFQRLWSTALAPVPRRPVSVLEPACGSANDYRFFASFGLARLIDYSGFDLCEKNVANARAMFPGRQFNLGNVFDIAAPDQSFELSFAHDLFEHLSPAGAERALDEMCRVTRTGLCLGFFSMHEGADHVVRPVADYHWNTLSLDRIRASLERHGFESEAIHIATFLKWRFACDQTPNPTAYTVLARARPSGH